MKTNDSVTVGTGAIIQNVEEPMSDRESETNYMHWSKDDQTPCNTDKERNNTENITSVDTPNSRGIKGDRGEMISILSSVDSYWQNLKEPFPNPETSPYTAVEVVIGNDLNIFHVGEVLDISIDREGVTDEHVWTVVKFDDKQMEVPLLRIRHTDQPYPILSLPSSSSVGASPVSDRRARSIKAVDLLDAATPSPSTQNKDSPSRTSNRPGKASPDTAVSFPMWIPPWAGNERQCMHVDHLTGDRIEVYRPGNSEGPASWTRAVVRYVFQEDPRKPAALGLFDHLPEFANGEQKSDCATFWGGVCDCILGKPCLGLRAAVPTRCVAYEIEWSTLPPNSESPYSIVPWYACRVANQHRSLKPADITTANYDIPEFLWKRGGNRDGGNTSEYDVYNDNTEVWVESEDARLVMNQLRYHSQVLLLSWKPSYDNKSWVVYVVGNTVQIGTATQYLENQFHHIKSTLEFLERREKRLKLLEERKSRYERNQQLEFEADDGLVGLIIGKQGEHLSRIARNHKVEIRVLPDDDGYRRVRIYGDNPRAAVKAKNELSYHLIYLEIDKEKNDVLTEKRGQILKEIAQRTNLNSIWIDQGLALPEEKLGIRDSTAVMAVESASKHPIKSKDVKKGTISKPVVILCGLDHSIEKAKSVIMNNKTYEEMFSAIGPIPAKRPYHMPDRPKRPNVNNRRY